ncbi:tetratricopeptide repeat protein, partial [Anaerosalibacter bizertensis]|nr:tetratricopeptide repeat protein [Anaerosalibacter bizertensis]
IKNYEKVIELDPLDDIAYNNMGYTYFKMKEYEKALKCYDKAIQINPNNKYAIRNRKQVKKYLV